MAAVRRTAGSGVLIALVVFVVLAFVGIGSSVWFYQQLRLLQQAIALDQDAFGDTVAAAFTANGWPLQERTPTDLGIRYTQESYSDVVAKLAVAAEYEKEALPLLGWESLEGLQGSMTESPVQKEAEARGEPTYHTLRVLLAFYEESYTKLSQAVADLRSQNEDLSNRLNSTQDSLVQAQQQHQRELSEATQKFDSELAQLRQATNELKTRHERQRQESTDWRAKYQQEVNDSKRLVAQLQDEARMWQERWRKAVAGPGKEERLEPDGEVIEVRSDYDFVLIDGGLDEGVSENERFVVYRMTPDGKSRRKGDILVGQVYERTSLATIAKEEAGEFIVQGDPYVSLARWNHFQGLMAGSAGGGSI